MRPIDNNLLASSLTNNQPITATSDSLLIAQWRAWSTQSQPGVGEQREVALLKLTECLEQRNNTLKLSNLNLTELPSVLPDHITYLDLMGNLLTYLPETLPVNLTNLFAKNNRLTQLPNSLPERLEVLEANNNQLTHLPERLPRGLEDLFVRNNQLRYLPENLPPELQFLYVDENQLTRVPESLPSGLVQLTLNNNQLTHLPETLPFELKALCVAHNQLTYLPDSLPSGLGVLEANHNRLTHLPAMLPQGLEELTVNDNQLTHLPEILPPHLEQLDINNNQITHLPEILPDGLIELNAGQNPLTAASREIVTFRNSPFFPLMKVLHLWDLNIDVKPWKNIAKEENADHFSFFLSKLHEQRNAASVQLHHIVSEWLTELAKEENKEVRTQTFAIAQMGSESCVDRASYYFNQMHSLLIEHRLTEASVSIPEIINTLRGLFRLHALEKISADHAEQRQRDKPGFKEDIEIYLAYQYKLKDELALPVHTELQFDTIANVTPMDVLKAKRQIVKQEQKEFLRHLVIESEIWKKKIEARDNQKWALANEHYLDEIASPDFERAVNEALSGEGISTDDEDAMRIMQQKMASERLFQIRFPLTVEFLKEHNALSLIETYANHIKRANV